MPVLKSENEIRKQKINETIKNFVDVSTCHGFKHCFNTSSKVRQLIWLMIFTGSVALLVQKLYESGVKFLERPFSTKTTLTNVDQMEFPAISICNLNDIRMSKLHNTTLDKILLKQKTDKDVKIENEISGEEYKRISTAANHELKDMLYNCLFEEVRSCNYTDFKAFYASQGDKCYTYNSNGDGKNLLVSGIGKAHSLILEINIEQYDYYRDLIEAGIRLIIHDQHETPVRMPGIKLSPGFSATVQIKKKKVYYY